MSYLHEAQLANTVTGFATCMAGIMPLLYTILTKMQPRRWVFVYCCIVLTGIPTVWFHANEASTALAQVDTASNIFLVWAIHVGIAGDFMSPRRARNFILASTLINAIVFAYMGYEAWQAMHGTLRTKWLTVGGFGGFYMSEVALILNSFVATGIFLANLQKIPRAARPLLMLTFFMFLVGLGLATANNDQIAYRIFAFHATWHIVGAFALTTLWLFNHIRFNETPGVAPA